VVLGEYLKRSNISPLTTHDRKKEAICFLFFFSLFTVHYSLAKRHMRSFLLEITLHIHA